MQDSLYHSLLRVSALTLALVLLFVSGLISPVTKELSNNTGQFVATAIGVNAVIAPTELNTVTAALTARERELDAREATLSEREIAVNLNTSESSFDTSVFILSVLLFILLVLIVLNYILDYFRAHPVTATAH